MEDIIIIEKKDDKWVSYVIEHGKIIEYKEFDDVCLLCLNVFESLDKDSTDYCVNTFAPVKRKKR